jgi:biopolymer transport protein ExbB/TolQ
MLKLFYEGGPLFMGILTIVLIFLIVQSISTYNKATDELLLQKNRSLLRGIGLVGLIIGILGQLIGMFDAFSAIQQMGHVPPAMLAGGLKVSMITTLYGLIIFLIAQLLWLGTHYLKK